MPVYSVFKRPLPVLLFIVAVALVAGGCGSDSDAPPTDCAATTTTALRACVADVNAAWQACLADTGTPCSADDGATATALDALEAEVSASCADGDFLGLSQAGVVERLRYSCESEADSLAWRTFGGPQAASWDRSDASGRACLLGLHAAGASFLEDQWAAILACLDDESCDPAAIDASDEREQAALADIDAACGDFPIDRVIALDASKYLDRARQQVECLAATTAVEPRFSLRCGPSHAVATATRGEYVRIQLDGDLWGTQCGDGSPYEFAVRLAPEGAPLDRVVIGLQGGGVCFFDEDCSARFRTQPGLFRADDDPPPVTGIMSNDAGESAFAEWTKVYLPYCNQDVFIGGGITESFSAIELRRYGAVNLRAAMQAFRDILWAAMDAEDPDGYRPGSLVALFGGWSAGAYGTMYNYHWILDDLLWQRTAAFPDAGLGLDNGQLGVRSFGGLLIPVWNALSFLPPYCFSGNCAVGPDNFEAISPRLKQVPEQQYLILSNQRDRTQQGDAFFTSEPLFINTMRRAYCETKDLPGLHWYLTSEAARSQHVVSLFPSFWRGEVDGIAMRDWIADAIARPDEVVDRAEEGDFATTVPGVQPFPCEVAP